MSDALSCRVESLYRYPVKACAGERVDELMFEDDGRIAGDRQWAVVDAQGELSWQGSQPRLALVKPAFDGACLVLRATGEPGAVCADESGPPCEVRIWNPAVQRHDVFAAMDGGDAAARLLETVTRQGLRLVRLGPQALRRAEMQRVHVVSQASIDEVGQARSRRGDRPLGSERFRANIMIDGPRAQWLPFLEEQLHAMHWSDQGRAAALADFEPCERCVVTNVDPDSGDTDAAVLDLLSTLSAERHPAQPVRFGVYARPSGRSRLTTGATVLANLTL
jgi:uncharacterized protein